MLHTLKDESVRGDDARVGVGMGREAEKVCVCVCVCWLPWEE